MAQFPAMPFWTDAYLGDTTHLTTEEHGAYMLLLVAMWRSGEARLRNDPDLLARYAKLNAKGQGGKCRWDAVAPVVMRFFHDLGDGYITQLRLKDEWDYVVSKSRRQSRNAKARWLKNKEVDDATALPPQSRGNAPTPTPTPTKEDDDEPKAPLITNRANELADQ